MFFSKTAIIFFLAALLSKETRKFFLEMKF